mmetsp:Transcript_60696/g.69347  ORF Transcript_60696/g.69347 Transcript_60696/m.69347 type:complete len:81 (+) Transcript_60696:2208-2450(+)
MSKNRFENTWISGRDKDNSPSIFKGGERERETAGKIKIRDEYIYNKKNRKTIHHKNKQTHYQQQQHYFFSSTTELKQLPL